MKTIDDLLEPWQQILLCQEENVEDLYVYNDLVLLCVTEVTECYYGHRLIQPIEVASWPVEDVKKWRDELMAFLSADSMETPDDVYSDIVDADELIKSWDEYNPEDAYMHDITEHNCLL